MNKLSMRVAGVTFNGRQEIIQRLAGNEVCQFRPEPENLYDPNAIAVYVASGDTSWHVGYVPRELASEVAKLLDGESIIGKIAEITGGFLLRDGTIAAYGLRVIVEIPHDDRL